ncbi:MrpF/PhaF family protein [Deinococcus hohokamensis]|uniref:MrpF/PhaF family protein n=1 Tax=Deinococcus hohokamensis TaxID=309883 RepID=A0ABV9I9C6_9DEIO
MNPWFLAATLMLLLLVPSGLVCLRGDLMRRLVGLELSGMIATLTMLLLAQAFRREVYFDLALACALLSFGAGLVFTRFLERWL